MADHITIEPAGGTWTVRAGGAVLVESDAALRLTAAGAPPAVYFPRGDVAMAFLERSDKVTPSEAIGPATHYHIVTKSTVLRNAAWSYEAPAAAGEAIRGHLAFDPRETVAIEQI